MAECLVDIPHDAQAWALSGCYHILQCNQCPLQRQTVGDGIAGHLTLAAEAVQMHIPDSSYTACHCLIIFGNLLLQYQFL